MTDAYMYTPTSIMKVHNDQSLKDDKGNKKSKQPTTTREAGKLSDSYSSPYAKRYL